MIHINDAYKHPFIRHVKDAFPHVNVSVSEMMEGLPLAEMPCVGFDEFFCRNLLKKVQNITVDGNDPEQAALQKFIALLDRQDLGVDRLSAVLESIKDNPDTTFARIMLQARRLCYEFFDTFCPEAVQMRASGGATHTLDSVEGTSIFMRYKHRGPGAQHLLSRIDSIMAPFYKDDYDGKPSDLYVGLTTSLYGKTDLFKPEFVTYLRVVPKYWNIGRVIGIGDTGVTDYQNGVGDWMTDRLKKLWSIDISKAQEVHKQVALSASLVDELMTVDQSNASDNILRVLVSWLIPPKAYAFLRVITPGQIKLPDGTLRSVHMMCPAGNGYLFPFQSMIFYTLMRATAWHCGVKGRILSYGDDGICPSAIAKQLFTLYSLLGLEVNVNKTFASGPIRESCGMDAYAGANVRPLYVNNLPTSTIEWYVLINGIRRVGYYNNGNHWRSNAYRRLWLWCIGSLRAKSRLFAPRHYGDVAINCEGGRYDSLYRLSYKQSYIRDDEFERPTKEFYPNNGIHSSGHPFSGWYIEVMVPVSKTQGKTWVHETQGISQTPLLRLTASPATRGTGDKPVFVGKSDGIRTYEYKFPHSYQRDEFRYNRKLIPFNVVPTLLDHDNIDDIFSNVPSENMIHNSSLIVEKFSEMRMDAIQRIMNVLRHRVSYLTDLVPDRDSLNF